MLFEGASPHFVDIDRKTYNIDCAGIEETLEKMGRSASKVKAILVVHCFGMPCDMDAVTGISEKHGLKVIEDACEAIGTMCGGRRVGGIGDAGCFGFYPNKQMTTGEGGMVVTNDGALAKACRSMRNQGRGEGNGWLEHERLGFNYRLSDINCALGLAQVERIDEILRQRNRVAMEYNENLKEVEEVVLPFSEYEETVSWFVYVIRLADKYKRSDRDRILQELRAKGIGCNNYFAPIHLQPPYVQMFGHKEGDFPVTEHVSDRTVALPFYNRLTEREVKHVVNSLKDALKRVVPQG
jgi:perosamine synthetase